MNDGAFTRNYTMFGLLVVVIFCGIFLLEFWEITSFFFVTLISFFVVEYSFHRQISSALESGEPARFSVPACFGGVIWIVGVALFVLFGRVPWFPPVHSALCLVSTYCKSLLVSLVLFCLFLAFKLVAVSAGIVKLIQVKRGCFAILHRAIVLLRSFLVTPFWIAYFGDSESICLWEVVFGTHEGFTMVRAYIVLKCIYYSQIIWDLDSVRREFLSCWSNIVSPCGGEEPCGVCGRQSDDEVALQCGHKLCAECAKAAINRSPFCPMCAKPVMDTPKFAFFDGSVSFSSVFCCF